MLKTVEYKVEWSVPGMNNWAKGVSYSSSMTDDTVMSLGHAFRILKCATAAGEYSIMFV